MRRALIQPDKAWRVAGFIAIAAMILAAGFLVGNKAASPSMEALDAPPTAADPLAAALAHCQAIGLAAQGDAPCEAAFAENRRRFFTYRSVMGAAPALTGPFAPAADGR